MEWSSAEVTAAVGLVGSAIAWSWASLVRAYTYRREQQQREWLRMVDITKVLYNESSQYGAWAQIAAAHEIATLTYNRDASLHLAKAVRDFWHGRGHADVMLAISSSVDKLEKRRLISSTFRKLGL